MSSRTLFRVAAAVVALVGLAKFLDIFIQSGFDITTSPWGFLLVFVLPFVVVLLLARSHIRAAAWVMIPFSLVTLAWMVLGITQNDFGVGLGWSDLLAGYVGGAACAVGFVAAIRSLAVREPAAAH